MNNKCKSGYSRLLSCLVIVLFLVSVVCIGSAVATPSYAGQADSHALYDPETVFVKCYPGTDSKGGLSAFSTKTPAEILADYSNLVPGLQLIKLPDGVTVEDAIAYYSKLPGVEYVEPNYYISISATPSDPSYGFQWGLKNAPSSGGISAPAAWDLSTGNDSIIVAVLDTGVDYNHPDLSANMWINSGEIPNDGIDNDQNGYIDDYRGWNAVYNISDPMDYNFHGTHCAGIIGAVANNGVGIAGTAWNVKIMPVSVLSQFGFGTDNDLIAGIEYAVANHADIISISLGGQPGDQPNQAEKDAIDAAGAKGIVCVIAAGNTGTNNDVAPVYPASYSSSNIISVAASDSDNNLGDVPDSWASNYGVTSVDIAAPGVGIYSTVPDVDNTPIDFPAFTDMGVLGSSWTRGVDYAHISGETSSLIYYNQPIYPSGSILDVACHLQYKLSSDSYLYYEISTKPFSSYTSIAEFEEDTENVYWLIYDNNYDTQGEYIYWGYWTYSWDDIYKEIGSGPYYIGMYYSSPSSNDFVTIDEIEFINYRISSHTYGYMGGTSMAAPMVAGAAAVLKSINSSLTPEDIRQVIIDTADTELGDLAGKTVSNGRLNLSAAALAVRPQYVVTFNSNGGSAVPSQSVYYKDTVAEPATPTKKEYMFDRWYADAGFTTEWNFTVDTVTAPTTLYAKWDDKKQVEETVNTTLIWNATIKAAIGYTLAGDDIGTLVAPVISNKKSGKELRLNSTANVSHQVNGIWVPVDAHYVSIDSENHVVIDQAAGITISDLLSVVFIGQNLGDADMDGAVTVNDAVKIAQSLVNITELDTQAKFYGDADSDGVISVNDAVKVAQYLVHLVDGDYNPVT